MLQTIAPGRRRLDGRDAILQHDVMHRLLELQSGQPASMDQCPGWPVVVMAVAQQEAAQLLTGLTQAAHRRQTRTQEIADSLMGTDLEPKQGSVHQPGAAWPDWSRPAGQS